VGVKKEEAIEDIKELQRERDALELALIPVVNGFIGYAENKAISDEAEKRKLLNRYLALIGVAITLQEQVKVLLLSNHVQEDRLDKLMQAFRTDAREAGKKLQEKVADIQAKAEGNVGPGAGG
jgi:hypothetical protein